MIAQFIMAKMGWSDAWFPRVSQPINPDPAHQWWWAILPPKGTAYVGIWTGKGGDMLCVKRCATNEESRAWASPGGRTLLDATLRAVCLRIVGPVGDGPPPATRARKPRSKARRTV